MIKIRKEKLWIRKSVAVEGWAETSDMKALLNHLEDLCASEKSIEKQEKREETIEKTKTKKR